MLLQRVIGAEQELDVSHGFAAGYLELVVEFQGGYVAGRDPSKISLDQTPRFGWNILRGPLVCPERATHEPIPRRVWFQLEVCL